MRQNTSARRSRFDAKGVSVASWAHQSYDLRAIPGRRKAEMVQRASALVCILFSLATTAFAAGQPDSREFFEMRIRPLLAKRCYPCHQSARMGGLEMTGREALLKGGGRGPAISIAKPEESLLIQALSYRLDTLKMPPAGKLPEDEIETLTAWAKAGAPWPEAATPAAPKGPAYTITADQRAFWSFQPVRKLAPPAVKNSVWSKSPIDRFLQAKREAAGVEPVKRADKLTLIRRAYYDLTGM